MQIDLLAMGGASFINWLLSVQLDIKWVFIKLISSGDSSHSTEKASLTEHYIGQT